MDLVKTVETIDLTQTRDDVRFSYSRPEQFWLKRVLIQSIEAVTGQLFLEKMYRTWAANPIMGENIFSAGIRLLGVKMQIDQAAWAKVPRAGSLLVVSNHPYGVVDGMAMGHLMTSIRPDTKIMTHSLLCQPPEAKPFLLPVDFGGTAEARNTSLRTRKEALDWLAGGHCVAIFPAGSVSTSQNPWRGDALDSPWHPFMAKLARVSNCTVLPLFFHGQNSRIFQLASHIYYPLRVALMFRESLRQMGRSLKVSIGAPIATHTLPHAEGRDAVVLHLREVTYNLSGRDHVGAKADYQWPSHVAEN